MRVHLPPLAQQLLGLLIVTVWVLAMCTLIPVIAKKTIGVDIDSGALAMLAILLFGLWMGSGKKTGTFLHRPLTARQSAIG